MKPRKWPQKRENGNFSPSVHRIFCCCSIHTFDPLKELVIVVVIVVVVVVIVVIVVDVVSDLIIVHNIVWMIIIVEDIVIVVVIDTKKPIKGSSRTKTQSTTYGVIIVE